MILNSLRALRSEGRPDAEPEAWLEDAGEESMAGPRTAPRGRGLGGVEAPGTAEMGAAWCL